jgi:hypothetical protein
LIEKRDVVEAALFKAIRERLGGICCEYDCEEDGTMIDSDILSFDNRNTISGLIEVDQHSIIDTS